MARDADLNDRLARLRADFDGAFALPRAAAPAATTELLLVRSGEARLALRLDGLSWVGPAPRIVRVPGGRPELVGLSVVRGRTVAVFDLARLASRAGGAVASLALMRADPSVAIGFTEIEARGAVLDQHTGMDDDVVTNLLPSEGGTREVVNLSTLLGRIRAGAAGEIA